jgi:hypothetical protein
MQGDKIWDNLKCGTENLEKLKNAIPGLIQVNNWKPIPFESITDNQVSFVVLDA